MSKIALGIILFLTSGFCNCYAQFFFNEITKLDTVLTLDNYFDPNTTNIRKLNFIKNSDNLRFGIKYFDKSQNRIKIVFSKLDSWYIESLVLKIPLEIIRSSEYESISNADVLILKDKVLVHLFNFMITYSLSGDLVQFYKDNSYMKIDYLFSSFPNKLWAVEYNHNEISKGSTSIYELDTNEFRLKLFYVLDNTQAVFSNIKPRNFFYCDSSSITFIQPASFHIQKVSLSSKKTDFLLPQIKELPIAELIKIKKTKSVKLNNFMKDYSRLFLAYKYNDSLLLMKISYPDSKYNFGFDFGYLIYNFNTNNTILIKENFPPDEKASFNKNQFYLFSRTSQELWWNREAFFLLRLEKAGYNNFDNITFNEFYEVQNDFKNPNTISLYICNLNIGLFGSK